MDRALPVAFDAFETGPGSKLILLFSDGRSPLDPVAISLLNDEQASVFPVAIGDNVDRAKLEMLAILNRGFATWMDEDEDLAAAMSQLVEGLSEPWLVEPELALDQGNLHTVFPGRLPTLFAGSFARLAGRYRQAGSTSAVLTGESAGGGLSLDLALQLREDRVQRIAERLWAREAIDELEREIAVYGPQDQLCDSLITLSLGYGIRCRYTSYFADYETLPDSSEVALDPGPERPRSFIRDCYPNPFNPTTTLRIHIHPADAGQVAMLRVYNLLGQLINVMDLGRLGAGSHDILVRAVDHRGVELASGVYVIQLTLGREIISAIQVTLRR